MLQKCLRSRTRFLWTTGAAILILGMLLAGCGGAAPQPTATPTRTPRPDTGSPITSATTGPAVQASPSQQRTPAPASPVATRATAAATTSATTRTPATTTASTGRGPGAGSPGTEAMTSPDFGIQAFLWWREEVADRDLGLIKDAGFHWVKQLFSWQDIEGAGKGKLDWSRTDRIVDQVQKYGLKLIVRVSADPDRPFWAGFPPESNQAYGDFVRQMAARYKGRIHAYQIWNEPNLAREWGGKRPDPAGYAGMLKIAYSAIKSADPAAMVITAGMAPTTRNDAVAMPDMRFYQGIYDAMGGSSNNYFDLLGVHGTGWAVAPETDPDVVANNPKLSNNDPSPKDLLRIYAFRHVEDVRALMVKNGDEKKRIAILEFGWTTDNRTNSPYYWHGAGAGIEESTKGKYFVQAYKYAAEHWQPWIGLMSAIYMPDINWTRNDEQYWWSIMGPGWPEQNLRDAYIHLCAYLQGLDGQKCKYDPAK